MKTVKLIPVLMAAMLVSACTTNANVKVSEPKFAKEGDQVKVEDFVKEFVEGLDPDTYEPIYGPAIKDSEFFNKDVKISSKVLKSKTSVEAYETLTRNGKAVKKVEEKTVANGTASYDLTNKIIKAEAKTQMSGKRETPEGKLSESGSQTTVMYLQQGKSQIIDDGKKVTGDSVIQADEKEQYYRTYEQFDEDTTKENWAEQELREDGIDLGKGFFYTLYAAYMQKDVHPEELEKYSCYKNGTVYTISYVDKEEEDHEELIGYDDMYQPIYAVIYHEVEETNRKVQMDVKEGAWALRTSYKVTSTKTYARDDNEYFKDDVLEEKDNMYSEASFTNKEPKLKALDVSSFKERLA